MDAGPAGMTCVSIVLEKPFLVESMKVFPMDNTTLLHEACILHEQCPHCPESIRMLLSSDLDVGLARSGK